MVSDNRLFGYYWSPNGVGYMKLKSFLKENWLVAVIAIAFVYFLIQDPPRTGKAVAVGMRTFAGVAAIIFAVFIFVGLFNVWVKEEQIIRHMGEGSGIKGIFFGAALGTVFHGPLVGFFPLLKSLLNKGARPTVAITAVSTFAIKIPMIPLEIKFLGARFTIIHNLLILATAPIIGLIMEKVLASKETVK